MSLLGADKAYNMFVHSLAWRRQHRPWVMSNPSTRTNKMSSDARIVGYDLQVGGRGAWTWQQVPVGLAAEVGRARAGVGWALLAARRSSCNRGLC